MIPEEYVNLETARLLKKAGFPQDIKLTLFFNKFGQDWHMADGYYGNGYAKPSQAQAMHWLRVFKRLSVRVNYASATEDWFYDVLNLDTGEYFDSEEYWVIYEAAAEAGIQAACKYLIELQKTPNQ